MSAGFTLAGGSVVWRSPGNTQLISGAFVLPRLDDTTIAIDNPSGQPVGLDLRNGTTRKVAAPARAWCAHTIEYHLAAGAYYQGKHGLSIGQNGLFPCTIQGRRTAMPSRIATFVGRIGATTDGMTAWTDTSAVHAVPS